MRSLLNSDGEGGVGVSRCHAVNFAALFGALMSYKRCTGCVYNICMECTPAFVQQLDKPELLRVSGTSAIHTTGVHLEAQ